MKKSYLLLTLLFSGLFATAGVVETKLTFGKPSITSKDGYDFIQFEGMVLAGKAGEPTLPYFALKMALPPGEVIEKVEIIPGESDSVPGTFHLYPRQYSRPVSSVEKSEFAINRAVYQSFSAYPAKPEGHFSTGFLKGISIGTLNITPVVFFPKEGRLQYYKSLSVRLYTKPAPEGTAALKNLLMSDNGFKDLKDFIQNPDMLDRYTYPALSTNHYQVLIITGSDYVNTFEPLVNLYLHRGLRSRIKEVPVIEATMAGQDLQEKIRNYIKQEYQDNGIEYVILGGDVEVVPARGFYCHVQSGSVYEDWAIPSDLYYSALDGSWDTNGNQIWGEIAEDDLLPEIAIGRMPFSTQEEAGVMISKSTCYQDMPVTQELNRVLLVGEKLLDDPLTWGGDYLDLLVGLKMDNGYTTSGIYTSADIEEIYDRDLPFPWEASQLVTSLNEGKPVVYHSGHASSFYNLRLFPWDITEDNFQGLDGINHNYSVVYSHGCYSGSFDEEDCFAEEILKLHHFAVEYVGNSRYGWFNEGSTEGPSEHLNREFVNALYHNEDYRIGETHRQSRINSSTWVNAPGQWEEGALRWCYYCCNVLGDPVLGLWTDIPVAMQILCPTSVQAYSDQMTVHVQDVTGAVEGVTCAFLQGNTLYGAAVTDNTGTAVIHYDEIPSTPGQAKLVVSGYNRLATTVPVIVTGAVNVNTIQKEQLKIAACPNPFLNRVELEIIAENKQDLEFSLFSMEGQLIRQNKNLTIITGKNSFDLTPLFIEEPAGVYYVRILSGITAKTLKIVKQ